MPTFRLWNCLPHVKKEIQSLVEQNIEAEIIWNGGSPSGQSNLKTYCPTALKRVPGQLDTYSAKSCKDIVLRWPCDWSCAVIYVHVLYVLFFLSSPLYIGFYCGPPSPVYWSRQWNASTTHRRQHCLVGCSTQLLLVGRQTCKCPPLGPLCWTAWSSCSWCGAQGVAQGDLQWELYKPFNYFVKHAKSDMSPLGLEALPLQVILYHVIYWVMVIPTMIWFVQYKSCCFFLPFLPGYLFAGMDKIEALYSTLGHTSIL